VPARLVTVVYCGHEHALRTPADTSVLERNGIEPGSYLLAVSSLNPNKNFAGVVRAIQKADIGEVPFVVAGGANPRVFAGGGEQDLPPGTTHVGRADDGALRALYENALALVYPSFHEGFGLPPLEAMALGCPVICSNTTSLPEVGGDAVLYCNPADDADIARQIRRLVDDPHLRSELSAKGRAQAAKFTWRDTARKLWSRVEPLIGR
jgi:glycosyltransferase involved in cell wall biosynthesis